MKKSNEELFEIDDHGAVTLRGADFTETWRPWGHPDGFGVEGCKRASYNGQLEPLLANKVLNLGDVGGPLQSITESIPEEIRKASFNFIHWPVEHLQLAECHPEGYLNLADQNPALLTYLCYLAASNTLWDAQHWGQLLGHNQKYIARQIGLDTAMVSYLARISDVGLLCHGYLELAFAAWRKMSMPRMLTHVSCINLDVILLALNEWDLVRECPSLLHIAAKGEPMDTITFHTVCVIRSALRRSRKSWRWDSVRNFKHLERIRDKALQQAAREGCDGALAYPSPPVSPCSEWMAITTDQELGEQADRHLNCALEHAWKMTMGKMSIFESRGTTPNDTIIVVMERVQGKWSITDILGTQNSLVDPNIEENVRWRFEALLETPLGQKWDGDGT